MALIHEQLIKVMQGVTGVAKRDRNYQQKFLFRGIDSVLNAVGPVLREHAVFILPDVTDIQYDTVRDDKGRSIAHVLVEVTYVFAAADGSTAKVSVIGEAMDFGDKAVSKAMSVALRIALLQTLALPTDEKDPDTDTYQRSTIPATGAPAPTHPTSQVAVNPGQPATTDQSEPPRTPPTAHAAAQQPIPTSHGASSPPMPEPTIHSGAPQPQPTGHATTAQPEPSDPAEQARQAILDWGLENNTPPIELARRFGAEMNSDIRTASVEALNNFYAMLSLGGEKVE